MDDTVSTKPQLALQLDQIITFKLIIRQMFPHLRHRTLTADLRMH